MSVYPHRKVYKQRACYQALDLLVRLKHHGILKAVMGEVERLDELETEQRCMELEKEFKNEKVI
jgi:hypothetical protein